jgi:hypothetical protein
MRYYNQRFPLFLPYGAGHSRKQLITYYNKGDNIMKNFDFCGIYKGAKYRAQARIRAVDNLINDYDTGYGIVYEIIPGPDNTALDYQLIQAARDRTPGGDDLWNQRSFRIR